MRFLLVLGLACTVVCAGEKRKITNEAGNENIDLTAKPLIEPGQASGVLGVQLPDGVIAVEVTLVPKGDYKLAVNRDDFTLLSRKDGQRSGPYSPSQIAGSTTMVVSTQARGGGEVARQRTGPSWGGIPGTGGRPRQMDDGSGGFGNTASTETTTKTEIKENKERGSPLLKALEEKMLPDTETADKITGLLYFPIEGKLKMKDLELIYKGPAGRMIIEFK